MLTENEWNTINNMLLELYTIIYEQNNENDTNAYSVHEGLVYHFRR